MAAFDTAKLERALRGPLGDEAARELTDALAGLTANLATKSDVEVLGAKLLKAIEVQGAKSRSYSLCLAVVQTVITTAAVAIATVVLLIAQG